MLTLFHLFHFFNLYFLRIRKFSDISAFHYQNLENCHYFIIPVYAQILSIVPIMSFYSYLSLLQKWIQDAAFIVFSCLISLDSLNLEHMLAQSLSFSTLTFLKTTGQWFCRMHLNWRYQIFPYDLIQTMHSVVFYTHIKLHNKCFIPKGSFMPLPSELSPFPV